MVSLFVRGEEWAEGKWQPSLRKHKEKENHAGSRKIVAGV